MTTDTQTAWDAEQAHDLRRALTRAAALVRERQAQEASRKRAWREARRDAAAADERLSLAVEEEGGPDLDYAVSVESLTRLADAAVEQETEARQHYVAARVARRKAQDELRAAVRARTRALPLVEWGERQAREVQPPGLNGDLSASVQLETARVPADQVDAAPPPPAEPERKGRRRSGRVAGRPGAYTPQYCGAEGPDGTRCIDPAGHDGMHHFEQLVPDLADGMTGTNPSAPPGRCPALGPGGASCVGPAFHPGQHVWAAPCDTCGGPGPLAGTTCDSCLALREAAQAPPVCGHEGCSLPAGHGGGHQFDRPRRGRKGGGRGTR